MTINSKGEIVNEDKNDDVNNPEHYKHGTFEVIDEMIMAFGPNRTYDFCILNAWKYRSRAPYKGTPEQDMEKADRYMQMAHQIAVNNELNNEFMRGRLIKATDKGEKNGFDFQH